MKHGAAVLRDPASRRLRALMMLECKIKGMTLPSIAKEFRVSEDTVKSTLSWARKAGLVAQQEDKILSELIPASHNAILDLLTSGESPVEAAKISLEIFKGMLPGFGKKNTVSPAKVSDNDELAAYINQLRGGHPESGVLEGEVAESPKLLESSPAAENPEQRLFPANLGVLDGVHAPEPSKGMGAELNEGTTELT
jgi:hypothetical protein